MILKFDDDVQLTTEHSTSSYGIPVLVVQGQAYGLRDPIPGHESATNPLAFAGYASGEQCVLMAAQRLGLENNELVQKFLGYRPSAAAENECRLQEGSDAAYIDN